MSATLGGEKFEAAAQLDLTDARAFKAAFVDAWISDALAEVQPSDTPKDVWPLRTPASYADMRWQGPPDKVAAALTTLGWPDAPVFAGLIGPVTIDGVAYVGLRVKGAPLPAPPGLADTGPEMFGRLFGVFA